VKGAGEIASEGTNGSLFTTSPFSGNVGDVLQFYFNYVTSDGSGFADYAWAALVNEAFPASPIYMFTARTEPTGNTSPGFDLPADSATLTPATSAIIGGAPTWSPLGSSSGKCFDVGCGYTGWIKSDFTVATAGTYVLEFGVTNVLDEAFDTGLAFDGATIGSNTIIGPATGVPEPSALWLLCAAAGVLVLVRSRLRA
jgi:hypothetical protein